VVSCAYAYGGRATLQLPWFIHFHFSWQTATRWYHVWRVLGQHGWSRSAQRDAPRIVTERPPTRATWAPRGQTPQLVEPFCEKSLSGMATVLIKPDRRRTRWLLSVRLRHHGRISRKMLDFMKTTFSALGENAGVQFNGHCVNPFVRAITDGKQSGPPRNCLFVTNLFGSQLD
jgi:hypothetical protein